MIKILKTIFFEPLVHFLLLGSLIYLYYASVSESSSSVLKEKITISSHEQAQIKKEYKEQYDKEISEVELLAFIQKMYKEKVLLSEAYLLALQKDDALIKEQLLKKMKFILHKSAKYKEPTEEELFEYYKKNIHEYSVVKELSFSNVYFSSNDAEKLKEMYELLILTDVNSSQAAYFGESLKDINYRDNVSYEELKDEFGKYFASKVFTLKSGVWHRAIHSKLGKHLVYVREKKVGSAYPFDEVQDRVYRDFLAQREAEIVKSAYDDILLNYSLELQK